MGREREGDRTKIGIYDYAKQRRERERNPSIVLWQKDNEHRSSVK